MGYLQRDLTAVQRKHQAHTWTPQRVHCARGASSTTLSFTFTTEAKRKSFRPKLAEGQKVNVDALRCGITAYTTDRKREGDTVIGWLSRPTSRGLHL
jgi:hypothetical protein